MTQFVPINLVEIVDRQRQEISPKAILELKRSILEHGLFHAPVLSIQPGPTYRLLAGGCRIAAIKELFDEGSVFSYNGEPVPLGELPFVTISSMTETELWEVELEENLLRSALTWLEETQARAKIHRARQATNPSQTIADTAREISERTSAKVETMRPLIARDLIITQHLDDPRVKSAKSASAAFRALLDEAETTFKAELIQRSKVLNTNHICHLADCKDMEKLIEPNSVDLILSDPPYGIEMDSGKKDSKHFYDDSAVGALDVCKFIIATGFDLTKARALMFMFCDIEHFVELRTYAAQQGWSPWRTPIIWWKGLEGHAPWGRAGFTRTYESILFCSKGQRELYQPGGPDVIQFKRVQRKEKTHAAEKPVELLEMLLRAATIPGDVVLDPCCGSGPIFAAGYAARTKVIGIERDKSYHAQSLVRLGELQDANEAQGEDPDQAEAEGLEEVISSIKGIAEGS